MVRPRLSRCEKQGTGRIKIVENLCRKEDLPLTLWAEYITRHVNVYLCILVVARRVGKS